MVSVGSRPFAVPEICSEEFGDEMKILAVDDEKLALEGLVRAIRAAVPEAEVLGYRDPAEALRCAEENPLFAVFLDIEMRGMDGITLAGNLLAAKPKTNIIFTTGYGEYAGKAFDLHASGYIMKPVTEEKVRAELNALRYRTAPEEELQLVVRAFGNFEAYIGGEPVRFQSAKAKELLAYLVDRRGAVCSNGELLSALWEDDGEESNHMSYLKKIRRSLSDTLETAGCGDVIVRSRGGTAIRTDRISCDYYRYLAKGNEPGMPPLYRGEYMMQYSWAEFTHGVLERDRH